MLKDYYKILEVPPSAALSEIKKSFRRLAQQYHPDKNAGSNIAGAHFTEIQEAYKILSDPKQREAYNYKRWYLRSTGQSYHKPALTPAAILQECNILQQYVASMNVFHVSYDAVSKHIKELLTASAIGILKEHNDQNLNRTIIQKILQSAHPLPRHYFVPVTELLLQVAGNDPEAQSMIKHTLQHHLQRHTWDKYKWVVMLVITALMCWLIYRYGQ
jgi:molecular chaperone DnaJ